MKRTVSPERETKDAVKICAAAFTLQQSRGFTTFKIDDLAAFRRLRPRVVEDRLITAMELQWITRTNDLWSLTAAGVFVAKKSLNLTS
jgi:hypothetical protein